MGRSTLSKNHPTSGCVSIRNPYTAKTIVSASRPLGENLISFSTPAAATRQPSGSLQGWRAHRLFDRSTSGKTCSGSISIFVIVCGLSSEICCRVAPASHGSRGRSRRSTRPLPSAVLPAPPANPCSHGHPPPSTPPPPVAPRYGQSDGHRREPATDLTRQPADDH